MSRIDVSERQPRRGVRRRAERERDEVSGSSKIARAQDCVAWVTVSKGFTKCALQKTVVEELPMEEEDETVTAGKGKLVASEHETQPFVSKNRVSSKKRSSRNRSSATKQIAAYAARAASNASAGSQRWTSLMSYQCAIEFDRWPYNQTTREIPTSTHHRNSSTSFGTYLIFSNMTEQSRGKRVMSRAKLQECDWKWNPQLWLDALKSATDKKIVLKFVGILQTRS